MAKRMILMLVLVAAFTTALGLLKAQQVRAAMAQGAAFQPPPEAVTTLVAATETWPATLAAIGTVEAVQGVTVSADLPGIVERITFESGRPVSAGAILVALDTSQERAQLAAAEARRDLARLQLDRFRGLRDKGVTSQAEYDAAVAEHAGAEAAVRETAAAIERKTIRAPFSGFLGIRQVQLGQYLQSGDPVVPLQALDPIHVSFAVPQQELARLVVGGEVQVTAGEGTGPREAGSGNTPRTGKVTAIDSVIDPATRNVRVQATFANPDAALKPGMFVEAQVVFGGGEPVLPVPASAVAYAPYGDSLYLVEEMTGPDGKTYRGVKQKFVKLGRGRGDLVAILSGLEPGQEVVTSGVFKLRNGAAVLVDNSTPPGASAAPQPADA
jgi:membrane fusion protein (multidrug efflux system)